MPSEVIDPRRRTTTSTVGTLRGEVSAPGDDDYFAVPTVSNRARVDWSEQRHTSPVRSAQLCSTGPSTPIG
jgi:hypothetical protein